MPTMSQTRVRLLRFTLEPVLALDDGAQLGALVPLATPGEPT